MSTQVADDAHWMREALAEAAGVLYLTDPNPRVGCVIVRDGVCLGRGATQAVGGPHAEIMALRAARAARHEVAGATIYVTLEPCSHHGRTPPCVDALLAAGPARVVVAMTDPNPRVAGAGINRLRAAGITVDVGLGGEAALFLNIGFVSRMVTGRPWVWLKSAVSLDGRTALPDGRSQWITGDEARADGHRWRARSSLVLTGAGTVADDDPQLSVRAVATPRQPIRAVLDSTLRVDPAARVLDDATSNPVWWLCVAAEASRAQALQARGARVVELPAGSDGRVDLAEMMTWLGAQDINEVHVEAGARLSGALLAAGLADELVVYQAPVLLGEGRPLAALPPLAGLDHAERYEFIDHRRCGADLRVRLRQPARWQALRRAVLPDGVEPSVVS